MPVLEEGQTKFLRKYSTFSLLVIDEWPLDHPDGGMCSTLLELLERRYDTVSAVFCTQYAKKDWHAWLGGGVHADAIMDRIVNNTIYIDTGDRNMREHATLTQCPEASGSQWPPPRRLLVPAGTNTRPQEQILVVPTTTNTRPPPASLSTCC